MSAPAVPTLRKLDFGITNLPSSATQSRESEQNDPNWYDYDNGDPISRESVDFGSIHILGMDLELYPSLHTRRIRSSHSSPLKVHLITTDNGLFDFCNCIFDLSNADQRKLESPTAGTVNMHTTVQSLFILQRCSPWTPVLYEIPFPKLPDLFPNLAELVVPAPVMLDSVHPRPLCHPALVRIVLDVGDSSMSEEWKHEVDSVLDWLLAGRLPKLRSLCMLNATEQFYAEHAAKLPIWRNRLKEKSIEFELPLSNLIY